MMTPELARKLARVIAENLPGPGPDQQVALEGKDALLEFADQFEQRHVVWEYSAWTGTLVAGDPGAVHCPRMVRVPDFARHVPELLRTQGCPMRIWWESSRPAVHSARSRLADRLEHVNQPVLAGALHDVVLEQHGPDVWACYEPQGRPVRIAD